MRRKRRKFNFSPSFMLVILIVIAFLLVTFGQRNKLKIPLDNVAALRIQPRLLFELETLSERYELDFVEVLTLYCLENNFFDSKEYNFVEGKIENLFFKNYPAIRKSYKLSATQPYYDLLNSIFKDIKYFPIPAMNVDDEVPYVYTDSWAEKRNYGGDRIHLGTDIMDRENIRGRIPVVSMTDGVIENIGWNEKGGWRVGIKTINGNYFYYAHLDSYADSLAAGMKISAGSLIGLMGDSGYGKKEGTKGNFAVHLHIGVMAATNLTSKEFWINPYPFLRIIEDTKVLGL